MIPMHLKLRLQSRRYDHFSQSLPVSLPFRVFESRALESSQGNLNCCGTSKEGIFCRVACQVAAFVCFANWRVSVRAHGQSAWGNVFTFNFSLFVVESRSCTLFESHQIVHACWFLHHWTSASASEDYQRYPGKMDHCTCLSSELQVDFHHEPNIFFRCLK